jgi:hypothetical protein
MRLSRRKFTKELKLAAVRPGTGGIYCRGGASVGGGSFGMARAAPFRGIESAVVGGPDRGVEAQGRPADSGD